MYGLEEYARAFKKGLHEALYGVEQDLESEQNSDNSKLASIGYSDGYDYGNYLKITGQEDIDLSDEQLMAEIDKWHTSALNRYSEELKLNSEEKDSVK